MEVINLDSVDLSDNGSEPVISLNTSSPSLTGAELLMNHNSKKKVETETKDNNYDTLDDLSALEQDLNSLTLGESDKIKINLSDINKEESDTPIKLNVDEEIKPAPAPAPTIKKMGENEKTWDGYQQFNNIPLNPDKPASQAPKRSREEVLKEKFNYLRKLEAIEKKGVRLSKQYTMDSSLEEMIGEYETIKSEKEKSNSIKFQGRMLMAAVTGLEFLNNRFDPFDFKLDGWSEQVNENIDDYDEIFGELHEKYSSKAKMAPELKLLFQLSGSAIMLHMTNSMFKSSMPGMDDILKQNPELMQQFTQAAVNQMGDERPGFSNFMNGMMDQNTSRRQTQRESHPVSMSSPPPAPMKTRNEGRMDNFGRPDIGFGRGAPESGVSLKDNFENPDKPLRSPRKTTRPEMKGPSSDIDELLSGLKTKTAKPGSSDRSSPLSASTSKKVGIDGSSKAKKSSRRPISEKNTISLDF